ncbi:restriction endonuclease subunit S [Planktothrix agardhii 1033]|nr:restriction endonuclease subunit S [Planktothrix agardhii 1033]
MRSYPKYKSSGVEWLGEIPEHWDRYRMKFLFDSINGGVWGEEPVDNQNDMICIRVADFDYDNGVINLNKLTTRNISFSEQKGRILKKGDLLIEKSGGGELSPVGRVVKFDLDIKAVCSNFINRLNTKNTFSPDFLNCLNKFLYAKGLTEICINQTIGIQNLKVGEFLGKTVFVPPIDEQHKIVNFLDYKTGQCDRFISNRQKQIELLNEQKAAIINKAVTKGINPNAKMKPSGIDWIGDIPEHWEVIKLKYVANSLNRRRVPIEEKIRRDMVKKEYDYYGATGVIDKVEDYLFDETTILIAEDGANLLSRNLQLVFIASGKYWVNNHAHILTPKSNCELEFLALRLEYFEYSYLLRGAAQPKLTKEDLMNIALPIPSKQEQIEILSFINKETSKIETLISKYQKQIELMQEYRTALISQAVTGKIDVREWKPPTK